MHLQYIRQHADRPHVGIEPNWLVISDLWCRKLRSSGCNFDDLLGVKLC